MSNAALVKVHEVTLKAIFKLLKEISMNNSNQEWVSEPELEVLEKYIQERKYFSVDHPRILLFGEFKSGKSTLINALLGGDYAAVDFFEMTAWVARYWASELPFCKIYARDGTVATVTPEAFKSACQERTFSKEELSRFLKVDIGLDIPGFGYSLIDAPGAGSQNRENEKFVIQALDEADIVMFTIDVDSIGSQRDMETIKTLIKNGTPYICVITKCDLLEQDHERKEIIDYLVTQASLDRTLIFPVSALVHLRNPSEATGIVELNRFLREKVVPRNRELRSKAELAHQTRLKELTLEILTRLENHLTFIQEKTHSITKQIGELVLQINHATKMEAQNYIKKNLFSEKRVVIIKHLVAALINNEGVIPEPELQRIFNSELGHDYMNVFFIHLIQKISQTIQQQWSHEIEKQTLDVKEVHNQLSQLIDLKNVQFNPSGVALRSQSSVDAVISNTVATGLGVGAIATAYAATLGPAAATLTVGAAMSTVGFPIALVSMGAAFFYKSYLKSQRNHAYEKQGEIILDNFIANFIEDFFIPFLAPKIQTINNEIGQHFSSTLSQQLLPLTSARSVDELIRTIRTFKANL